MLRINNKELLFSGSFTIAKGEQAILEFPAVQDVKVILIAEEKGSTPDKPSFRSMSGGGNYLFYFPFMTSDDQSLSFEILAFETLLGKISGRVAALPANKVMIVQADFYIERGYNPAGNS